MNKGLLIVVSSPSGCGKGTILNRVFAQNKNLKFSVSATTRKPREGEIHGENYYFITKDEFKEKIQNGEMLEYAEFVGNLYGTPKDAVLNAIGEGTDVVLEIEVLGGKQVKEIMPECVSIFIAPPSLEVLEQRLVGRGTEDDETIAKRLDRAKEELEYQKDYDYVIVNDDLDTAVEDVLNVIKTNKSII